MLKTNVFINDFALHQNVVLFNVIVFKKNRKRENVEIPNVLEGFLMKRIRPDTVPNVNFQYESSNETQNSYFLVFAVDQTSKKQNCWKSNAF